MHQKVTVAIDFPYKLFWVGSCVGAGENYLKATALTSEMSPAVKATTDNSVVMCAQKAALQPFETEWRGCVSSGSPVECPAAGRPSYVIVISCSNWLDSSLLPI